MSILKKLVSALRGGTRETCQTVVDANALRILEQEIVDQANAIDKAKDALTEVMADQSKTARRIEFLTGLITNHEANAARAIAEGSETLALDVAEKIAELENERADLEPVLASYTASLESLQDQIRQAEKALQENRRELSVAKATMTVQRARATLSDSITANISQASAARDSLTRIRERQKRAEDKMNASAELDADNPDANLKERLAQAGIGTPENQAADVVSRLKQKYPLSENLLKNLIVVAMSNNRIHENERKFLMTLAGQMGVDQAHLGQLIRDVMHGDRNTVYAIENRQEFEWLCEMAMANGSVDEKQYRILSKLGTLLKVSESEINNLLSKSK